ncbi:uncharacterized protein [Dysidea avara]|uniref:uncharacterized protein isoform X2 n=1 Tax=Dysidea avara TaxID=196820 RepID=UPI0033312C89
MRHEARGVATKWYTLGVELLDGDTAVLDVIETNHQSDDDRCSRMFKKWLEMKTDASWSKLVTALNDIGLNSAADSVHHKKLSKEDTEDIPTADTAVSDVFNTAEQASVEFAILLQQILKELKKNKDDNLELLKIMSSTLTVKDKSGVRMFGDAELESIKACNDIDTLLVFKLRHCYRWDDHSMLSVLMSSLNAVKCLESLEKFQIKIDIKMKLQEIYEHCLKESSKFPEGYHKMVAIVDKKIFSSITKEEYDELKQFISQHCGVEPYVMSPFSKVSPFSSVVFEWFIPVNAVSYMIETAKNNIHKFTKEIFLYLKISKTVIFDHRDNEPECDELLTAAKAGDVVTVERLIHTRYIDVNTTDPWGRTALHDAAGEGQVQQIETLIRLGADVNALDNKGRTVLHHAAWLRQVQAIETLIRLGADMNALDNLGRTTLHRAAWSGQVQAIETLISSGADVNALSEWRRTALHDAAMMGQVQAIETLIRLGADVNALDQSTQSKIKKMLEHNWSSGHSSDLSTWKEEQMKYKIMMPSSKQPQTQSHTSTEKSPSPSSFTTKQSSTFSDHKSTTSESRVSSHGLEVKQKEQEQFIKSSDDDGGKVVDTNTWSLRCILM